MEIYSQIIGSQSSSLDRSTYITRQQCVKSMLPTNLLHHHASPTVGWVQAIDHVGCFSKTQSLGNSTHHDHEKQQAGTRGAWEDGTHANQHMAFQAQFVEMKPSG